MSACKSCGRAIRWVKMVSGTPMPLDLATAIDGNVAILANGTARVLPASERPGRQTPLYKSHFATCPNGPAHRKAPKP